MRFYLAPDEAGQLAGSVDVTEAVKVLYDLCISSMDFRSGFWNAEDAAPVAKLGELAGFEDWEEVAKYVSDMLHGSEQWAFIQERQQEGYNYTGTQITHVTTDQGRRMFHTQNVPHECVFSSQGKCMWRGCTEAGFE